MPDYEPSEIVIRHHACNECGSSDAASTYDDGHTYCFSCGHRTGGNVEKVSKDERLLGLTYTDLAKRGIYKDVCIKYGYGVASYFGKTQQVAEYRRKGAITSQHLRDADKNFNWINYQNGLELFGQHLFQEGGKELIITEGEIDALTWAQVRDCKWPVVGVPGVGSIKSIKHNLTWISSFDAIYLYFDMDEAGQSFAQEVAAILPAGKVFIGSTAPFKDSNDLFLSKGSSELFKTKYQAKKYKPSTILTHEEASQLKEDGSTVGISPLLFTLVGDVYEGNLIMIGAGSNIGKSLLIKHLASTASKNNKVAFFPFEEGVTEVSLYLASLPTSCTDNIFYYNDAGLELTEDIIHTIKHLAIAEECKVFFIDHITSVFNQSRSDLSAIDSFLQELQAVALRLGVVIIYNSHVKDADKGNYEEGAMPTSSSFRGSGMLYRIPDIVLVLARNIKDEIQKHTTTMMCLKHRKRGLLVGNKIAYTLTDNNELEETVLLIEEEANDF